MTAQVLRSLLNTWQTRNKFLLLVLTPGSYC